MTVLIHDGGLYPYAATKLAESFGCVLYFTPYSADNFPVSRKALWGSGLPGVTRIKDFWDYVDDADVIVFPDIGNGDLQAWLRTKGYRVWGSAEAEVLEQDRVGLKRLMKTKGMDVPPTWILDGMDELREHLEDPENENQYVKLSEFRGDFETHHHQDAWGSQPWLRRTDHQLGPMRDRIQFVVEGHLDGVEVGFDGFCVDGRFPLTTVYGYEAKDVAYIGRVARYSELPAVLRAVNNDLAPVLGELGCRSMFSTEVRVAKDGTGYLIDPSLRFPSPPSEAVLETFSNWPEIFYAGADGEIIEPIVKHLYCAELVLRSPWAENDFLALQFPDEFRSLIKLHGHAIVDGVDHVVSLGMDVIGAAVGLGDTMDEACAQAIEVAKSIQAEGLEFSEDEGFDAIKKSIEQGIKCGVNWD